ncbi:MAG: glutamine amidotransferase-related protein, partial [bacterium]
HSLTVAPGDFPACLTVTAETADGVIMGLAHREHPVHGVQFHPESIASEHGHQLLQNFLRLAAS